MMVKAPVPGTAQLTEAAVPGTADPLKISTVVIAVVSVPDQMPNVWVLELAVYSKTKVGAIAGKIGVTADHIPALSWLVTAFKPAPGNMASRRLCRLGSLAITFTETGRVLNPLTIGAANVCEDNPRDRAAAATHIPAFKLALFISTSLSVNYDSYFLYSDETRGLQEPCHETA
jgi:hypothetical protein